MLDPPWFRHSGDGSGYHALLVGSAENGHAAVVMTNGDGGTLLLVDVIATIAEVFGWPHYLDERATITPDPATLRAMPGNYEFEPGFDLVIRRVGDRLLSSGTGLPEAELFATAPTEFFRLDLDATTLRWADETLTFDFAGMQAVAHRTRGDTDI